MIKVLGDRPGALTQVLDGAAQHQLHLLRRRAELNLVVDQAVLLHVVLPLGDQSKQNL